MASCQKSRRDAWHGIRRLPVHLALPDHRRSSPALHRRGQGPTLLFLHGNPTSSYLWRNVIKPLRGRYRCVAPDLIGFGRSDKPELDYGFLTHYHYIRELVAALDLKDVTLVLHDWGGPIGFRLAQRSHSGWRGCASWRPSRSPSTGRNSPGGAAVVLRVPAPAALLLAAAAAQSVRGNGAALQHLPPFAAQRHGRLPGALPGPTQPLSNPGVPRRAAAQ
ncbi:alpha/beta fold hydrolase [Alcanivorax sp. IO_7]|nr:alpha/beta fold hydrolase [Alcanivorax sp. IO_7]